jgi:hypothetical protein
MQGSGRSHWTREDTEDEATSTPTSDPITNQYHDAEEDDNAEDGEKDALSNIGSRRCGFFSADLDPKLKTFLNGPQWQLANPYSRRAKRVNYALNKTPGSSLQVCATCLVFLSLVFAVSNAQEPCVMASSVS